MTNSNDILDILDILACSELDLVMEYPSYDHIACSDEVSDSDVRDLIRDIEAISNDLDVAWATPEMKQAQAEVCVVIDRLSRIAG